jgi:hypothetical protein
MKRVPQVMFLTVKKVISLGAALIFVATWFVYGYLQNTFIGYPHEPVQESGKVIPHLVKGGIVYIREDQDGFLHLLGWLQAISGTLVVLILILHWGDPFRSKS